MGEPGLLYEREIFDVMKQNLRSAAADCDMIARFPQSGVAFTRMRRSLKLVEGACRQAAQWREDARWLPAGIKMEEAHQIARVWLHRPSAHSKKMFTGLGQVLRQFLREIERLETMKTGKTGSILLPHGGEHNFAMPHVAGLPAGLRAPMQ